VHGLPAMGERTSAVHVARGTSYLWVQTLATTMMQVVGFAFIARLITTSDMGLLAILALMVGLAQLITPPLPRAIIRFAAEELAQGHRENAAATVYQSTKVDLTISAAVAVAYYLLSSWLSAAFSAEPIVFQLLAVDVLFAAGLTQTLSNGLVGAQRFRDYSLVTTAYSAVRQILIVGLLLLFHRFLWLVFAWVISDVLYVLMMLVALLRVLGSPSFGFSLRRLLGFSLPLLPGNAVTFVYNWYDRALLVPYASLAALGVYNATLTAFTVLAAIPGGIATALYPAYAEIQTTKGKSGLQDAIRAASRYVSFIATPLALGLFATARPALALFVGEPYESGSTVLQILSLFLALTALANAFGSIFLLLGRTAIASAITAASVAASLVTALLLLPFFGINGAAISRGIGMLVSFVLTLAIASREIKLSFDREALWKSFIAGIAMVVVVWLAQQVCYNRSLLPAYAMLGTCTYLAGLRLLRAVHRPDVELAGQVLGKRYEMPVRMFSKILETRRQ
jgi:O-antigen/teichoic acid export membrane protein